MLPYRHLAQSTCVAVVVGSRPKIRTIELANSQHHQFEPSIFISIPSRGELNSVGAIISIGRRSSMSSRSKDKVTAAIRKFFKSPDKKEKNQQKENGASGGGGAGSGGDAQGSGSGAEGQHHSMLHPHPVTLAVAGAIVPSGSSSSSNNSSSKGSTDSPLRRLRW